MKRLIAIALSVLVVGCATVGQMTGQSPEAQIATGANTVRAATSVARVLFSSNKITVMQAKSYNAMLHTAAAHLDDANATLLACRANTMSTQHTVPDPCAGSVIADIQLGASIATDIKAVLDGK